MKYSFFALIITCYSLVSLGQENTVHEKHEFGLSENRGKFFIYWGYNRTRYAKSNIKLIGPDYDFTLKEVEATDLPKDFSMEYLNPAKFTIPQFNVRAGFFLSDKYAISAGWNHMKYRTVHGSDAIIDGYITPTASSVYSGNYNNDAIVMDQNQLVRIEHSDGFNVININLERHDLLVNSTNEQYALSLVSGVGFGIAVPWTNSFIFGARNDDRLHFSGAGAQAFIAPEAIFFKRIFFRYTAQFGFANMWDIKTTPRSDKDSNTHAEQTIYYFERSIVMGYRFRLFRLAD